MFDWIKLNLIWTLTRFYLFNYPIKVLRVFLMLHEMKIIQQLIPVSSLVPWLLEAMLVG